MYRPPFGFHYPNPMGYVTSDRSLPMSIEKTMELLGNALKRNYDDCIFCELKYTRIKQALAELSKFTRHSNSDGVQLEPSKLSTELRILQGNLPGLGLDHLAKAGFVGRAADELDRQAARIAELKSHISTIAKKLKE